MSTKFSHALDRIKVLEADIEELERQLDYETARAGVAESVIKDWRRLAELGQSAALAAETELATLRAQLAAGEWRPVTEKPEGDDLYITLKINGYWRNGLFRARSGDEIWDRHVLGWQYTED